ncbi:MAG TPA: hypothetical protein VF746_01185 [Longimicrobium sp.]|jgi:hypothetical protein
MLLRARASGALQPPAGPDPRLDPERIIETVHALRGRIEERFPGSGLGRVAGELLRIANVTVARVEWVKRPVVWLRVAGWLLVLLLVAVFAAVAILVPRGGDQGWSEFLQGVEAGLNELVLMGAAVFFLVTVEQRIKRRRALGFLRELRALAHIVDMHQLTKDPDTLVQKGHDTPSSPRRTLTRYELSRYLDYCAEMLALDSKLAALYAQNFDDPVVLGAVDEVETLCTGLSGKVWQKLLVLNQGQPGVPRGRSAEG